MLSLEQLVTPVAEDDALASILSILSQLGFQATSWQSGSIQLTMVRLFARLYAMVTVTIAAIATGAYTTLSSGDFLTLLAAYVYDLQRLAAQPTIGQILLTSSAGAPTTTWNAGDIIVSDQPNGTAGANTFTVDAPGSLAPGSSVSAEFVADIAGAAGNIAPGTMLYLWTPLVGVTATNPALEPTSNTWVTTPGADPESDARLIARCIGRWSQLTYGNTDGAYTGWALAALPALTRTQVLSAPGDGSVTLACATSLGPINSGQITTIENYVYGVMDGIGRRPINDVFAAVGATTVTSPALVITAYVLPSVLDTAAASITAALLTYIGTVPIGGTLLVGTQGRVLLFGPVSLSAVAQAIPGVKSLSFNISSDVLLSPGQIYLPAITVNVQSVQPGA